MVAKGSRNGKSTDTASAPSASAPASTLERAASSTKARNGIKAKGLSNAMAKAPAPLSHAAAALAAENVRAVNQGWDSDEEKASVAASILSTLTAPGAAASSAKTSAKRATNGKMTALVGQVRAQEQCGVREGMEAVGGPEDGAIGALLHAAALLAKH